MMEKIDIKDASIAEEIRKNIAVASRENNGLMSKNGLMIMGDLQEDNLENVGTAAGYTYATGDGSGLPGPFISIHGGKSCIQFKSNFTGNSLKFRVYNQENKVWTKWKTISFIQE